MYNIASFDEVFRSLFTALLHMPCFHRHACKCSVCVHHCLHLLHLFDAQHRDSLSRFLDGRTAPHQETVGRWTAACVSIRDRCGNRVDCAVASLPKMTSGSKEWILPASLCSSSSPPPPLQSSDPLLVSDIHAHAEAVAGFKNVGEVGLGVKLAHPPLRKGPVYQPLVFHS